MDPRVESSQGPEVLGLGLDSTLDVPKLRAPVSLCIPRMAFCILRSALRITRAALLFYPYCRMYSPYSLLYSLYCLLHPPTAFCIPWDVPLAEGVFCHKECRAPQVPSRAAACDLS